MLSSSRSKALVMSKPVRATLLKADVTWVLECALEKREWSLNSLRQESDGVIRCVGSRRTRDIARSSSFRAGRRQKAFLSVAKLTMSGAEVKFGSKGSWIDLHTDSGVQRVPVRVKGKTFGLTIRKTDAWIIPENSDPAPRAVVALVEEEIGRAEQPNRRSSSAGS